ncbi:MAG: phosphotransferase [archaeon]|nr:phosphotransferase [archaeon]
MIRHISRNRGLKIKRRISKLLNVPIKSISIVAENKEGMWSEVIFACINGKEVVFKRHITKKKYPRDTEKVALKYLELRGMRFAPELIARSKFELIQKKISGTYFARSDKEIIELGNTLFELHSLKFKKFGTFGKGRKRTLGNIKEFFEHWFNSYIDYSKSSIDFFSNAKNSVFVDTWIPKINAVLKKHKNLMAKYLNDSENSLVHFDLHNQNIITFRGKKNKIKIIDWDNAQVGDPALDIAIFVNMAKLSKRQLKLFYSSYRVSDKNNFVRRVNNYRIIYQAFRLLGFADGIRGNWRPRATKKIIISRMIKNLLKFSELIKEPLSVEESQKIVIELYNMLQTSN